MFELKKDETISKTFRIPKSILDQLEKLADEEGMSLSKVVVQCCAYALEHYKRDKDSSD